MNPLVELCGEATRHFWCAYLLLATAAVAVMSRRGSKFSAGPTPFKVHFTNTEAGKTIAGMTPLLPSNSLLFSSPP